MVTGLCELCRVESELIDSHLLPKSAYKQIRGGVVGQQSPVILNQSEGTAFSSDAQVTQFLLCKECEDLFSKNGERQLGKLWSTKKGFALRDSLHKLKPIASKGHMTAYNANEIEYLDNLFYFAVSVFWRAHVWNWGGRHSYGVALGEKYSEMFRSFLLKEGDITDTYLMVSVNSNSRYDSIMSLPTARKEYGGILHTFHVPGLRFELLIGQSIQRALAELFKIQGRILISMFEFEKTPLFAQLSIFANYEANIKGKLAIQTAEIRAKREAAKQ